ncbi:MAG TPA: aryl-sulfate sulfotransferase [Bacteroidota bacterium]|nr:aryl-sulfate sulfotransferase [Bacteroidota bacterium]
MKLIFLCSALLWGNTVSAQVVEPRTNMPAVRYGSSLVDEHSMSRFKFVYELDSIPSDLPLPNVTVLKTTGEGYIFAAVPYWGQGTSYLAIYDNAGRPVAYKKVSSACTDFKLQRNGLLTYYDYEARKYFVLDSALHPIESYAAQHGFSTDEHDIQFLENGNVLLIGYDIRQYDMSRIVDSGSANADVIVNVVQEIDPYKRVVFEWKAYEHYQFADVGPAVNLRDQSFRFTHINSVDLDRDGGLIVSARHLNEISKIDRTTGAFIWRLGGKKNQFTFIGDSAGFSGQHSARVLPNGNLLIFDNGVSRIPAFSRAVEYHLDTIRMTAECVWSYRASPDIASEFWGNAQRLGNGNTFISWGHASVAATEVDQAGQTVFEMSFPSNVFSYRIFRYPFKRLTTGSAEPLLAFPSEFSIKQNYPNPFNPSTTLEFSLPCESQVTLRIYDMLGRKVESLANGRYAAGVHQVRWNAGVPSGVYVYRFEAVRTANPSRHFVGTGKMQLIR